MSTDPHEPIDIDQQSDCESYEPSMPAPKMRTITEFDKYLEFESNIRNLPGCKGKCWRCLYDTWGFLIKFELLLQFLLLIVICVGTYYGALKGGVNIEKAMQLSLTAGVLSALFMLLFHAVIFYCSSVKLESGQRIRNTWHPSSKAGCVCLVFLIIVVCGILYSISTRCKDNEKHCDIMAVISSSR